MMMDDPELLQGFVEESLEHLGDIENDLLTIEENGADIDDELVNKVFRAAHSVKGGAGFMGLTVIQDLAHHAENVFGLIRSKKLIPNGDIINVLLKASDALQALLEDITNSNDGDASDLINSLIQITEGKYSSSSEAPQPQSEERKTTPPEKTTPENEQNKAVQAAPEQTPEPEQKTEAPPEEKPEKQHVQAAAPSASPQIQTGTSINTPSTKKAAKTNKVETSIRVHVSLLDELMNLAGELVLSRNQLLQTVSSGDHSSAEAVGQRIDLVTSELQEAIMQTRMQPIGNVFNKFPRVVRDLAGKLNRQIDLELVGKEVELDKTIIEAINDPLTHLVRNSVDHGIEHPDDRIAAGKKPTGTVVLKAYHEAGQVAIEISDDGKGIDGQQLAAAAVNKGLITSEQAAEMSEKEQINLIFLPGFSMAKKVTDVSGRGVGMDVVKTNLDKLGGSIEIDSEVGKGSTISIKLPLTLAIIPCQVVVNGGERYAIPQVNLEELLRIPAAQVKDRVEKVGDAAVVRLRGNLLPLIRLSDILEIERTYIDPEDLNEYPDRRENIADRRSKSTVDDKTTNKGKKLPGERSGKDRRFRAESALNIVVVSTGSMTYGLIVDQLQDSEEIVIKPLGRHIQHCKGYAGATIMGDGRIALILDVNSLAQMADFTSLEGSDGDKSLAESAQEAILAGRDRQALLIFRSSTEEQFAVPLNQVERIEKIKASDIEDVGGRRVMQYRGGSLPLMSIDEAAVVQPLADQDDLLVIVFNLSGKDIGLLAIGPVDATEVAVDVDDLTLKQPGIMGSAIIKDHTTMLVSIFELVETINPEWFADKPVVQLDDESEVPTILLVEDSAFFRNQVKGFIEDGGFNVLTGEDGLEGWEVLEERSDEISLVVTDIEMPKMNGFELTEKIKNDQRFNTMPVIALTSLAGAEDRERGMAAGVDEYHLKLDKEQLMASVHHFVK